MLRSQPCSRKVTPWGCVSYDKRTIANDLRELMKGLDIRKIALVGHDRGARVATRFAKDHLDPIDGLVMMDSFRHVCAGLSNAWRGAGGDGHYRANADDVAQDLVGAEVKIARPVMSPRDADFYAVGKMFDIPKVWGNGQQPRHPCYPAMRPPASGGAAGSGHPSPRGFPRELERPTLSVGRSAWATLVSSHAAVPAAASP